MEHWWLWNTWINPRQESGVRSMTLCLLIFTLSLCSNSVGWLMKLFKVLEGALCEGIFVLVPRVVLDRKSVV